MARNSAREENLLSRLEGIRHAVDETKKLRAENERLREVAGRLVRVLRDLIEAEKEFVEFDAELTASEAADHEGGPPDTLLAEHAAAHTKHEAARKAAHDLLAEMEKEKA